MICASYVMKLSARKRHLQSRLKLTKPRGLFTQNPQPGHIVTTDDDRKQVNVTMGTPKFNISVNYEIVEIGQHMRDLEKVFGGVRPAARAADIDVAYWSRLRDGNKTNPSEKVLKKLGLQVITVTYFIKRRVDTKQVS